MLGFTRARLPGRGVIAFRNLRAELIEDRRNALRGTDDREKHDAHTMLVRLKTADKTWLVVLAPPGRMENRGLPKENLAVGGQATVVGYPHRSNAGELRAERITIKDKTTELR